MVAVVFRRGEVHVDAVFYVDLLLQLQLGPYMSLNLLH